MPDVSARGIYYRLEKSPYTCTIGAITFYFSSPVYRQKFYDNVKTEIDIFNYRTSVRAGVKSTAFFRPAFEYYKKIETRGFYAILRWLGKEYPIKSADDLAIADIPEVIFNGNN